MTPTDGPILIAAVLFIIGLATVGFGLDYARRQRIKEELKDTAHRREEQTPGGNPIIPEGKTILIGTPGTRDRHNEPANTALGRKVLALHFAAKRLQVVATTGTPEEILDAMHKAWGAGTELRYHIIEQQPHSGTRPE